MSLQELREQVHRIAEEGDEQALKQIIEQYGDPMKRLVEGEPGITVEQYNREIDEAMARIDSGRFVTMNQVIEESKAWTSSGTK